MENMITINQSSTREGENYWSWSVWIDAPDAIIKKIDMVEYILHPTFPNRVRRIFTKENNFKLASKGWGEFMIYIKIYVTNTEKPIRKNHYLTLFSEEETPPVKPMKKMFNATSEEVQKNKTVFISSAMSDYIKVEDLTKKLNKNEIEVKTQETIKITSNFTEDLNDAIKNSDVFILYGLDKLTRSQKSELDIAIKANKEIIIQVNEAEKIDRNILENKQIEKMQIINNNDEIVALL